MSTRLARTIVCLFFAPLTAEAQTMAQPPAIYSSLLPDKTFATKAEAEAWCNGWQEAARTSMQNRNHFQMMGGKKLETHETAIARIYAEPSGFGKNSAGARTIEQIMLDGIDLYVVLPTITLTVSYEGGTVTCEPLQPVPAE